MLGHPIGWLSLSTKFRSLPKHEQADFLAVFGIFGNPSNSEIRITKKSPAQLLFSAVEATYDEGPLTTEDLSKLDMNRRGANGTTALMLAAGIGHLEAVKSLLKHGADINALDHGGWSALRCASYYGHENCVEELLRRGADLYQRDLGVYGPRTSDDMPDDYGYGEMWKRVMNRLKQTAFDVRQFEKRQLARVNSLKEQITEVMDKGDVVKEQIDEVLDNSGGVKMTRAGTLSTLRPVQSTYFKVCSLWPVPHQQKSYWILGMVAPATMGALFVVMISLFC